MSEIENKSKKIQELEAKVEDLVSCFFCSCVCVSKTEKSIFPEFV